MGVFPQAIVDLSGSVGAGAGDLMLRLYDEPTHRRITVSWGGSEGDGVSVPWAAIPAFEAGVGAGGASTFVSAPVDLTALSSGIALAPAMPAGFFFLPSGDNPLRVILISSGGSLTTPATIKCGNNGGGNNYGSGPMDSSTFGGASHVTGQAFGEAQPVTLADLATAITLAVTTAAVGTGGFSWIVRFALSGSLVAAF
jgi:hypothetical protein